MSTEPPTESRNQPSEPPKPASQEMLLDLNFVPTWAKGGATGKNPYEDMDGTSDRRGSRDRRGGGRRDDRRKPRGGGGRGPGDRSRSGAGGQRGPRHDDRGRGGPRSDRRDGRGDRDRRGGGRRDDRRRDDPRPRHEPPLQIDIRFLPDRNMLGAAVREMHKSLKAYPIMDLASLFIQKPDHYLIKLQAPPPRDGRPPLTFYQCRRCRAVFTDEAACEQHAVGAHLGEYFDMTVVEGDPPRGNFLVIGRCRRTGTLLGPPNHHAYTRKLQEMVATRFPGMSLDAYRAQVEMVRDPEVIEQWKNESRQQKQFRLKTKPATQPAAKPEHPPPPDEAEAAVPEQAGETDPVIEEAAATLETPAPEPEGEAMSEEDARRVFREKHLPKMILHGNRAVVPAEIAQSMEEGPVKRAIREAWFKESRFPLSVSLAMRPAFRHMRLHMFKTNRKHVFVTAVKPKPLDPGVAIESIRNELNYLHDHPGCNRQELVEALRPGVALESPEVAEVVSNLRWLVEKGHVIEFYDGRLSVPSEKTGSVETSSRRKRAPGAGKRKIPPDAPRTEPPSDAGSESAPPTPSP